MNSDGMTQIEITEEDRIRESIAEALIEALKTI